MADAMLVDLFLSGGLGSLQSTHLLNFLRCVNRILLIRPQGPLIILSLGRARMRRPAPAISLSRKKVAGEAGSYSADG